MKSRRRKRLLSLSLLLVIAVFSTIAARPAAAGNKVFDENALRASIRTRGFARVLVRLNTSEIKKLTDAALAHKTITPFRAFSHSAFLADRKLNDYIHSEVKRFFSGLPISSYKVNRTYDFFPVVAMDVSADALNALESSAEVSAIMEDRPVPLPAPARPENTTVSSYIFPCSSASSSDVDIVGARSAWAKGYTGAGWYVAILDSGVLTSHELFAGKNIVEACFSRDGDCPNGQKEMYGTGAAKPYSNIYDGYEHGTHVAGIAAGNGGSVLGVAKDANIIAVQIFSTFTDSKDCDYEPCVLSYNSDQLAALNYILQIRGTYPIAAVNMSIGGDQYSSQASCDSAANPFFKDAIDELRNAGIATVSVSGNDKSCNSIETPGCLSSAIAVGALDSTGDAEASFNNWQYSMLDLLAPGVNIVSAVPDSPTSCEYLNGTSMAAPQVTGAWAILKQKDPEASVSDILYALQSTGVPVHSLCSQINDYKPRINVGAALSPPLIPVPSDQVRFDYAATDSPVLNVSDLPYPVGVGPVAGTGDLVNLRVGIYKFTGPVDIYVALYAPSLDPDNYYYFRPDDTLVPAAAGVPVPWKSDVTGPVDQSLTGEIHSSQLPASTYYIYLLVTPSGTISNYYLLSTSFVNNGP